MKILIHELTRESIYFFSKRFQNVSRQLSFGVGESHCHWLSHSLPDQNLYTHLFTFITCPENIMQSISIIQIVSGRQSLRFHSPGTLAPGLQCVDVIQKTSMVHIFSVTRDCLSRIKKTPASAFLSYSGALNHGLCSPARNKWEINQQQSQSLSPSPLAILPALSYKPAKLGSRRIVAHPAFQLMLKGGN